MLPFQLEVETSLQSRSHHLCQFSPLPPPHFTGVPISGIASPFLRAHTMPSHGTGLLVLGYNHLSMVAFSKMAVFPSSHHGHRFVQLNLVLRKCLLSFSFVLLILCPWVGQREILQALCLDALVSIHLCFTFPLSWWGGWSLSTVSPRKARHRGFCSWISKPPCKFYLPSSWTPSACTTIRHRAAFSEGKLVSEYRL